MPVPFIESFGLPLLAAFAGSLHCAGMCGGLAGALSGGSWRRTAEYQLGRLIAYSTLGGLAGWVGQQAFTRTLGSPALSAFALLGVGAMLAVQLWGLWWSKGEGSSRWAQGVGARWGRWVSGVSPHLRSVAGGVFTALLPCGWLGAFAFAAATSGSPIKGIAMMLALGLGSFPALVLAPTLVYRISARLGPQAFRMVMTAFVLLAAVGASAKWIDGVSQKKSIEQSGQSNLECHVPSQ